MNNTLKNLTIAQLDEVKETLSSVDEMYELLTKGAFIPVNKLGELMKVKTALENAAVHLTNFVKVVASINIELNTESKKTPKGARAFTGMVSQENWMDKEQEGEIMAFIMECSLENVAPGGKLRKDPLPGTEDIYTMVCESLLVGPESIIVFDYTFGLNMKKVIDILSPDTKRAATVGSIDIVNLYWILCGVPETKYIYRD